MKNKTLWYYWSKALGEKASQKCNKTSDKVAIIRTFIFFTYLITNVAIVANAVRHWNDKTQVFVEIHSVESTVPEVKIRYNSDFE